MGVAEERGQAPLRLTVKEKVLLELSEHLLEEDLAEYSVELTQKGLSECVGVRRSHIALSLQGLVEDELVYVRKARIEGEQRKQNIYALTPNGVKKTKEIKDRVLSTKADFEMLDGVKHTSAEDFLKISNASMMSVVRQLERGQLVRDEITIVTRPEKKLITVFCPTCQRYLEVENTYVNETVSFDCPGCGRPYKIAPAERVVARAGRRPLIGNAWPAYVAVIALVGAAASYTVLQTSTVCASIVIMIALVLSLAVYVRARSESSDSNPKRAKAASISMVAIPLGFAFIVIWSRLVAEIDLVAELTWFMPLVVGVVFGYVGIWKVAPSICGEFVLALGAFLVMLAVSLVSMKDFGGLSESSAPFVGVLGITLVAVSTTFVLERNLWILDLLMASGALILLISLVKVRPDVDTLVGGIALTGLVLLGAVLTLLRPAQDSTDIQLGRLFVSTLPFAVGALFFIAGVLMISGGSPAAGVIEIGLMAPFIYYGLRKVFDKEWMYRLPIASLLVSVELVSYTYAFMT